MTFYLLLWVALQGKKTVNVYIMEHRGTTGSLHPAHFSNCHTV